MSNLEVNLLEDDIIGDVRHLKNIRTKKYSPHEIDALSFRIIFNKDERFKELLARIRGEKHVDKLININYLKNSYVNLDLVGIRSEPIFYKSIRPDEEVILLVFKELGGE